MASPALVPTVDDHLPGEQAAETILVRLNSQQSQLWVSDPKALQHIVVKEQDIYELTDMTIQ